VSSRGEMAFEAIADPTRRAILRLLADEGESSAGDIASGVAHVGRTAVSSHLRILRAAGLVNERRQGRHRLYELQQDAAEEVMEFLAVLYRSSLADLKLRAERASGE
jgi:ArsR family transcriptional regulator